LEGGGEYLLKAGADALDEAEVQRRLFDLPFAFKEELQLVPADGRKAFGIYIEEEGGAPARRA